MTKYWIARLKRPSTTVYVTTTDTIGIESREAKDRHARLANEAIGNYASTRGLLLRGRPEEISAIPVGLREVGWLRQYATPHDPVSISATVYEAADKNQRR
jgi:hypothetical protein